jgi:hypothetical protein
MARYSFEQETRMKRAPVTLLVALLVTFLAACASKEERPVVSTKDDTKKFDKNVNFNGTSGEKMGVRDDQVVIQKRSYLESELARLASQTSDLQETIYGKSRQEAGGLWDELRRCRQKLADPRLGGTGQPDAQEKWENIVDNSDDMKYVVDKYNTVMSVNEEEVSQRLVRFRKYKAVLSDKYDSYKDKLESCQNRYRTALIQHGLNPNDTEATGEWIDGPNGYRVWKMRRPTTDDPEELAKRKQSTN